MAHEHANVVLGEALKLHPHPSQRAQASIGRIMEIPGDQQGVRLPRQAEVHDPLEGQEGRLPHNPLKVSRNLRQSTKRTVEVQVCRMDKPKGRHRVT